MPFYVQYNDPLEGESFGRISATVYSTNPQPPSCDNQIVFDDYIETENKVVDLEDMTLIPDPTLPPEE